MLHKAIAILLTLLPTSAFCKDCVIANVGPDAESCDIHVRAPGDWQLAWGKLDDENYSAARMHKTSTKADDISGWVTEFKLVTVVNGNETVVGKKTFTSDNAEFSVRLACDIYGLRLFAADGDEVLNCPPNNSSIASPLGANSEIIFSSASDQRPSAITCGIEYYPPSPICRFEDPESLREYLRTSTDPLEGIWQYMDRDFRGPEIQLGGHYRIAIVRNGQSGDGYDIIYLDGADDHPELWKPLNLKGRLKATPFINLYDVTWYDSSRKPHSAAEEVNARTEGSILCITFPLANSSIRFARQGKQL